MVQHPTVVQQAEQVDMRMHTYRNLRETAKDTYKLQHCTN